jgi:hypothetical protein
MSSTAKSSRNKSTKRAQPDSPPTSPIRPSSSSAAAAPEPAEKKARVEPSVDQAVAPQLERAGQDAAIGTALARLATPLPVSEYDSLSSVVNEAASLPAALEDLLRPLDSKVQKLADKKLFDWWKSHETYFLNKAWGPRAVTPKTKVVPNGSGWVDINCTPLPPRFRSCPWVDVTSFAITRQAVENLRGRMANANGGQEEDKQNNFFVKAMVMSGGDYISQQEQKYHDYMRDTVVPTAMLVLAKSNADFKPKTQLLLRLTNDESIGGRGKYKSIDDVPLDEPELVKLRDEWLANGRMQFMHKYFGTDSGRFVYYTRKPDAWKDGVKIPWGNKVAVKMAVVMPDCSVQSFPVDKPDQVALLQRSCPFTAEHSLTMRVKQTDKEQRFKVDLSLDSVTFFPQQATYMKMRDNNTTVTQTATDEEREIMAQAFALLPPLKTGPPALTHQPDSNQEEFGAYRVEHA